MDSSLAHRSEESQAPVVGGSAEGLRQQLEVQLVRLEEQLDITMSVEERVRSQMGAEAVAGAARAAGFKQLEKKAFIFLRRCERIMVGQAAASKRKRGLTPAPRELGRAREAHESLIDAEFEKRAAQNLARPEERPLSRRMLIEGARQRRSPERSSSSSAESPRSAANPT